MIDKPSSVKEGSVHEESCGYALHWNSSPALQFPHTYVTVITLFIDGLACFACPYALGSLGLWCFACFVPLHGCVSFLFQLHIIQSPQFVSSPCMSPYDNE